jgi:SAM-dependent methyltransferase
MPATCDLCGANALRAVYAATPSPRGLTVYVCETCGLVQSLPRHDRAKGDGERRISAGADWGNVRYGKGFRAAANLNLVRQYLKPGTVSILDVGANRGAFSRAVLESTPNARIVGLEPDATVVAEWAHDPAIAWIEARIEEAPFADESFDLVYSCHTIEHLRSPRDTLADHWRVLAPGGILLVEAPNLALIGTDTVVEEFFIDKHLYHFSATTLTRLIERAGFEIVAGPFPADLVNVTVLARKISAGRAIAPDPEEAREAARLMAAYQATRARNLSALAAVARKLQREDGRKIAIWGAGRLLDCLVEFGGLEPKRLAAVVDAHLTRHVSTVHGAPLSRPGDLVALDPDMIVIMSRSFEAEIADHARKVAPRAEIVTYEALLGEAKRA